MDLLNELRYQFGTKDALEGRGVKNPGTGKIEPNLFQRALGITSDMLETADDQGDLNRFDDTSLGQDAKRYGVDVTRADMDNLGGIQDRIDKAKSLRTNREVLTGLGYKGDVSKYTTVGGLGNAIRQQQEANAFAKALAAQNAAFNNPAEVDRRATRDRQYNDALLAAAQTRADLLRSQDRTLQFQVLQAQRENDRYYDRLEREDRKDLREGYKQLGLGLAALTAAFTIV